MRLATIARTADGTEVAAVQLGEGFVGVDRLDGADGPALPHSLFEIVQTGALDALRARVERADSSLVAEASGSVRVLAPWRRPGKIIGIGLNYSDHARDLGAELPTEPATFLRPSTAIAGPGDPIRLPGHSARVTAEAELGLVIGRRCRNVSIDEARDVVFGFVSIIDVTAEDILKRNPRFLTRSKSFDSFFQWGPVIVTRDEVSDLDALRVRTMVGGSVAAENVVANMTVRPYELVSFLSREMTLEPGDVFSTGTPGAAAISAGDVVRCEITGFPPLEAPVVDDV
jgi:2-keto-4-pentenoate hydratase/2-oxohepta-3-ene-1,7-dioic acid hydratase in catechol pathway